MEDSKEKESSTITGKWISLLSTIASIFAGLIGNLTVFGIKENNLYQIAIAAVFVTVLVVFTLLLLHLQKKPSIAENIKQSLEQAYCEALEKSLLNPNAKREDRHA